MPADQAEQIQAASDAINVAANLYTSGQFFGVLIVMLLGAILVTNEFFHLTATTTFLVTPRRERGHPGQARRRGPARPGCSGWSPRCST